MKDDCTNTENGDALPAVLAVLDSDDDHAVCCAAAQLQVDLFKGTVCHKISLE